MKCNCFKHWSDSAHDKGCTSQKSKLPQVGDKYIVEGQVDIPEGHILDLGDICEGELTFGIDSGIELEGFRIEWDNGPIESINFDMESMQNKIFEAFRIPDVRTKPKCECGNSINPIGQGHSGWCQLFKQEF